MNIKLLIEHHLGFLSLKGGFTGLSESIHVKMPHCWKSHVMAHLSFVGVLQFLKFEFLKFWKFSIFHISKELSGIKFLIH